MNKNKEDYDLTNYIRQKWIEKTGSAFDLTTGELEICLSA